MDAELAKKLGGQLSKMKAPAQKPESETETEETPEAEGSEDLEAIAETLLKAIESKDASSVADALKAAVECCK